MHLGLRDLAAFSDARRENEQLVLATVTGTAGSTYRKAGAKKPVAQDGGYAGLISGACLEDDLVRHAQGGFASGEPRPVSYDLHDDEDLVLNLGLGCGRRTGRIKRLFRRLSRHRWL